MGGVTLKKIPCSISDDQIIRRKDDANVEEINSIIFK